MKNLDPSPVNLSRSFVAKIGTWTFLQWKDREIFSAFLQMIYPNLSVEDFVTAVYGCTWALSTGTYTLQPGYVYVGGSISGAPPATVPVSPYDTGELFLLPSVQTVTPSGGNYAILVVSTTYYEPADGSADPVIFTDNSSQTVHQIRTLTLASGNSSTDGFVCYLDTSSPQLIYAAAPTANLFKAFQAASGINIDDSGETILTLTTPTISSVAMTFRFSGNIVVGTPGIYTFKINVNGTAIKTSIFEIYSATQSIPVIVEFVAAYTAGQSITVTGICSTIATATINGAILVCECLDAH